MAYEAFTTAEVAAGEFWTADKAQKTKDNFDFLFGLGSGSSGTLNNGSFDIDADSSGSPDNWTVSNYSGGSNALDSTNAKHGAYALKFTHPGTGTGVGGGNAVSDYFPCTGLRPFVISFLHNNSQAGCDNRIIVKYYDEDQVALNSGADDETVWSQSSGNPTSWTMLRTSPATPPGAAQYAKIQVIGGLTGTDPGSSTDVWFDGLSIVQYGWSEERATVTGSSVSQVNINDLPTERDVLIIINTCLDTNDTVTVELSDDNQSTIRWAYAFTTNSAATNSVVHLQRLPNGDTIAAISDTSGSNIVTRTRKINQTINSVQFDSDSSDLDFNADVYERFES